MANADWSQEQLERDLAAGFSFLGRAERRGGLADGEADALADGVLRCMNGALLKVSESLEAQARLRRELSALQDEFRAALAEHSAQMTALKRELETLRSERPMTPNDRAADFCPSQLQPPATHLERPLVIRSAQGDFLGVTGRSGQALTLAEFLRLVEAASRSAHGRASGRVVGSFWECEAGQWRLVISVCNSTRRESHCFALETQAHITPSGNHVTLLASLRAEGALVPPDAVAQLFRKLRDSLQSE